MRPGVDKGLAHADEAVGELERAGDDVLVHDADRNPFPRMVDAAHQVAPAGPGGPLFRLEVQLGEDFPADVFALEVERDGVEVRRIGCADDIVGGDVGVGLDFPFADHVEGLVGPAEDEVGEDRVFGEELDGLLGRLRLHLLDVEGTGR